MSQLDNCLTTVAPQTTKPTFNKTYEIVVIGAGVIGTTIAERLQYEGRQVLLVDKEGVGLGCSQGNVGHFATDIILPLANFSTLLKAPKFLLDPLGPLTIDLKYLPRLLPWLSRFAWAAMPHKTRLSIEVLKRLNRPSIERYQWILERTDLQKMMSQQGAMTIFNSQAGKTVCLKQVRILKQHGINVEVLNNLEVLKLEPELDQDVMGGLYFPDTAHTNDPYRLVKRLAESCQANGGEFYRCDIKNIIHEKTSKSKNNGKLKLVTHSGETITANKVIIACGAWSKPLAQLFGHKVPLESERGYHLMFPNPGVTINRPLTSYEKSFVMTPMKTGLRLAGTVELAGLSKKPNFERAEQLFTNAKGVISHLDNSNATSWMGHRPSLPDSLPVISKAANNEDVIFAFGHQHLGLTQAAVTADLVSDLLVNKMDSFLQKQLSITRF